MSKIILLSEKQKQIAKFRTFDRKFYRKFLYFWLLGVVAITVEWENG